MIAASEIFEFELKCLDFTPNGKYLICGGEYGTVYSLNTADLSQINTI